MHPPGKMLVHRDVKFVGKCIYCGATENLHDEHCIPESLNGLHILGKGSCRECGKITSRFEGDYARASLLAVRTVLNMKSKRSKKKRPTTFATIFKRDGSEETVDVPIEDSYPIMPLVEVGPPGCYPTVRHPLGLKSGECRIHLFRVRPEAHLDKLLKKYEADSADIEYRINVNGFLRMIAKIAYSSVVYRFGLSNIVESFVVPAILGKDNDIEHWVGSDGLQQIGTWARPIKGLHIVNTYFKRDGIVRARVKLFKVTETPEYEVVVGRLNDAVVGFHIGVGAL